MPEICLKSGSRVNFGDLIVQLLDFGYERAEAVEMPGQFSVSGGTITLFLTDGINPVKLDFFGPEVETISHFELESGKKIDSIGELVLKSNILSLPDKTKIKPGDYVVHEDYGIGLFHNLGMKKVGKVEKLYIFLEYRNGDLLYVPEEMKHKLSPYIGIGHRKPQLSRLGSQSWQKTYKKTYENVIHLAKELLNLYAVRSISNRKPWKIDQNWNEAIVDTFPYIDTEDQRSAIEDTYSDVQREYPMDRLISGDVGFGKTEVAIRTAAQAVANGYQVVLLVPTTILVEQHYVTFLKRFKNLPVVIEHLSRFVESKEQKRVVEAVKNGQVDILIGTHRLLGEDINFKNLGLYIIDEEQRFGVKQKEKLKKIREEVNVLTMSATPIPRTLFMSLSGIRDISQITTPPGGRKRIETKISPYSEKIIKEYVDRELGRSGQVYYLHNEVSTIEGKRIQLQRMFPKARIATGHGQMGEDRLARVMRDFADGKVDILVCSTIIENGLDLPNANTLIVEESDRFGLAQLHQIRGRIGRSPQQAYALFTYGSKDLSQNAIKRLKALAEHTELGAGFNIALSDLEIRGGGNILGKEQHGSMEAVGLILYSKLLKEAVNRLKKH